MLRLLVQRGWDWIHLLLFTSQLLSRVVGGLIVVRSQGLICFDGMSILTSLFSWAVRLLGGYRDRPRSILFCFVRFNGFRLRGRVAENGGVGGGSVAVL